MSERLNFENENDNSKKNLGSADPGTSNISYI